jgi:hypothetical protein
MGHLPPSSMVMPVSHAALPDQILARLRRGVMAAGDLQAALDVSPATVRRALDDLGPERILRMGQGRATRYGALRVPHYCGGSSWPLHEVTPQGEVVTFATLHALTADQWYLEPQPGFSAHPMQAGSVRGVFDGLPWFLETARPQGFLGRLFAHRAHQLAQFPVDLNEWTDDHVLASALMLGDDLPGNLLVGQAAFRFSQQSPRQTPLPFHTEALLETSMRQVLNGESVGSSAGGEQPKFTLTAQTNDGAVVQRIVKFSPERVTPGTQRWGDLLVAEHVANQVLRAAGVPAAATSIREVNGRIYLESDRFDRQGTRGRQGITALGPVAGCLGYGSTHWNGAAAVLAQAQVLNADQVERIQFIQDFGRGIGNTDMHLGNLSLLGSVASGWDIAPVYDMTPMAYIPGRTMEVSEGFRTLPTQALPAAVVPWVHRFWTDLAQAPHVSPEFQAIARHHASTVAPLLNGNHDVAPAPAQTLGSMEGAESADQPAPPRSRSRRP